MLSAMWAPSHTAQLWLPLEHSRNKQGNCGRSWPGLLSLKRFLKTSYLGSVRCTGWGATIWEADNTCQSNQTTCRTGWEQSSAAEPQTQRQLPQAPTQSPAPLPHQGTHWCPVMETPNHRLASGKRKSVGRFLIWRIVFSSIRNIAKSSFMLLRLVTQLQCLFLKLHRKDFRTLCINMHIRT